MPIEADLEAFSPDRVAAHDVRGRAVIYIAGPGAQDWWDQSGRKRPAVQAPVAPH